MNPRAIEEAREELLAVRGRLIRRVVERRTKLRRDRRRLENVEWAMSCLDHMAELGLVPGASLAMGVSREPVAVILSVHPSYAKMRAMDGKEHSVEHVCLLKFVTMQGARVIPPTVGNEPLGTNAAHQGPVPCSQPTNRDQPAQ